MQKFRADDLADLGALVIEVERLGFSAEDLVSNSFGFGSLSIDQVLTSVDLFAKKVMPALSRPRVMSREP